MKKSLIAVAVASLALAPAIGSDNMLEQLCRNTGPSGVSGNIVGQKYYEGNCLSYAQYNGKLILRLFVPNSENSNEGTLLLRTTDGKIAKEPVQYTIKDGGIIYKPVGMPTQNLTAEDLKYLDSALSVIESEIEVNQNAHKIPGQSV